ncbi:UDP-N-acetylmuramoyl-L-alanyl-D-glutamate--2,6-diaminopimelate ligase [Paenibacillus yanchengensis]|uniref:UDP-N-acetylmuramoyl-L-alanyl-D-glutamate--2,6-diaminopimelate ligase n=1 Tax=Paenibacillus yanchengensis TaxID=2035833 RepID=A0ABW4YKN1_9BACL
MKCGELTKLLITARWFYESDVVITGMTNDSRKVVPGDLFVCLHGYRVDGHQFVQEAIEHGAVAIVTEKLLDITIPQLLVNDSVRAMAMIATYYYDYPLEKLSLIGVTGTNGKTTTTYLLERLLEFAEKRTGVIGTIEMRYADKKFPMLQTTPHSLELQHFFANMRDEQIDYCVMEVSSHALEQGRVLGCSFRTAIFTNLTQDHLDYHQTMSRYEAAKGLIFSRLGNRFYRDEQQRSYAVLNADDQVAKRYAASTAVEVVTYGIENKADVRATNIQISHHGSRFMLHSFRGSCLIELPLAGKFNIYNALAAITAALLENISLETIRDALADLCGVPGRVEKVESNQKFSVYIDYAHTPDGLQNVLYAVREITDGKLITVFGCGGERDRSKRPLMGKIAATLSDHVIVTSDNPRSEDPALIMKEIEQGIESLQLLHKQHQLISDRREAIKKAIEMAGPSDVVLIAGKGHETYQLIDGVSHPFDDRIVAKEAIRGL